MIRPHQPLRQLQPILWRSPFLRHQRFRKPRHQRLRLVRHVVLPTLQQKRLTRLLELMQTDVFAFHAYAELRLDGAWVKATPAFDRPLCARMGVAPLEFDGRADALLQPFDATGRRHMEYVRERGSFADFPFEAMVDAWREVYLGSAGAAAAPGASGGRRRYRSEEESPSPA